MDVAFNEENEDPVTKSHDPFAGFYLIVFRAFIARLTQTRSSADLRLVARHPEVYGPSDDSFVLVDALLAEKAHLRELHPRLCVEVGCGSGYVITSLALMLELYKVDLISGLEKRLAGAVDVLIFNPPCVPTLDEEVGTSAWAGGNKGRVVIDRMLKTVDSILSKKGRFYLVTVTANNPGEICQIMRRKGFSSRIVIQRHSEEESLHVLKFWREKLDHSSGSDKSLLYSRCASALHVSLSHRLSRLVSFK
ncbi:hypothetical protein KP509_30G035500 [Ceratopteris richardii]|uniref:Methyltransferase small domain-containing protein n=1 Tax=Ceratopteris richardii TaxID=49495 RepID=A0A8T2R1M0_CERRI|nr:hypothetical protein KP509_30G035500 [Ceratopteris richardii]